MKDLEPVKKALEEAGIPFENAKIDMIPDNYVELDVENARKALKLIDALENSDDVQAVYSNMDMSESVMSVLEEE